MEETSIYMHLSNGALVIRSGELHGVVQQLVVSPLLSHLPPNSGLTQYAASKKSNTLPLWVHPFASCQTC